MAFSYRVSLQVRHPYADPQRIIKGIGLPFVRSWAAGERRATPNGKLLPGAYTESYCAFDIGKGDDGELADFLRQTLKRIAPSAAFIAELRQTGGTLNFFITWTPGERGEVFDVTLLTDMARLGIALGIEPLAFI
ncbi:MULTISPECIES: hypothetical protein [Sphingopyxis]|uniref:hypothetical protein n=1 Tax=Sphingopyxis TaxID=165697 RepID=UPI0015C981F1|nr:MULTISPECIES: hypothetical protein [Sphingopyxis]NYF31096.1 hypothetical protein [Sphingopyxis sp. JAI108]